MEKDSTANPMRESSTAQLQTMNMEKKRLVTGSSPTGGHLSTL